MAHVGDELRLVLAGDLQVLNRPSNLSRAGLYLLEQPCVLDGDHRLARKALEEVNLLVRKGADLLAINANRAHHFLFLEHGNDEERTRARQLDHRDNRWATSDVGGVRSKVDYVTRLFRR